MKELRDKAEKHAFQAEVSRMMKLIINSLYRNKEVNKLYNYCYHNQLKHIDSHHLILLSILDLPQGVDLKCFGCFGQDSFPLSHRQVSLGSHRGNVHQDQSRQGQQCLARYRHWNWNDEGRSCQKSWYNRKVWNERVLVKITGLFDCGLLKCVFIGPI